MAFVESKIIYLSEDEDDYIYFNNKKFEEIIKEKIENNKEVNIKEILKEKDILLKPPCFMEIYEQEDYIKFKEDNVIKYLEGIQPYLVKSSNLEDEKIQREQYYSDMLLQVEESMDNIKEEEKIIKKKIKETENELNVLNERENEIKNFSEYEEELKEEGLNRFKGQNDGCIENDSTALTEMSEILNATQYGSFYGNLNINKVFRNEKEALRLEDSLDDIDYRFFFMDDELSTEETAMRYLNILDECEQKKQEELLNLKKDLLKNEDILAIRKKYFQDDSIDTVENIVSISDIKDLIENKSITLSKKEEYILNETFEEEKLYNETLEEVKINLNKIKINSENAEEFKTNALDMSIKDAVKREEEALNTLLLEVFNRYKETAEESFNQAKNFNERADKNLSNFEKKDIPLLIGFANVEDSLKEIALDNKKDIEDKKKLYDNLTSKLEILEEFKVSKDAPILNNAKLQEIKKDNLIFEEKEKALNSLKEDITKNSSELTCYKIKVELNLENDTKEEISKTLAEKQRIRIMTATNLSSEDLDILERAKENDIVKQMFADVSKVRYVRQNNASSGELFIKGKLPNGKVVVVKQSQIKNYLEEEFATVLEDITVGETESNKHEINNNAEEKIQTIEDLENMKREETEEDREEAYRLILEEQAMYRNSKPDYEAEAAMLSEKYSVSKTIEDIKYDEEVPETNINIDTSIFVGKELSCETEADAFHIMDALRENKSSEEICLYLESLKKEEGYTPKDIKFSILAACYLLEEKEDNESLKRIIDIGEYYLSKNNETLEAKSAENAIESVEEVIENENEKDIENKKILEDTENLKEDDAIEINNINKEEYDLEEENKEYDVEYEDYDIYDRDDSFYENENELEPELLSKEEELVVLKKDTVEEIIEELEKTVQSEENDKHFKEFLSEKYKDVDFLVEGDMKAIMKDIIKDARDALDGNPENIKRLNICYKEFLDDLKEKELSNKETLEKESVKTQEATELLDKNNDNSKIVAEKIGQIIEKDLEDVKTDINDKKEELTNASMLKHTKQYENFEDLVLNGSKSQFKKGIEKIKENNNLDLLTTNNGCEIIYTLMKELDKNPDKKNELLFKIETLAENTKEFDKDETISFVQEIKDFKFNKENEMEDKIKEAIECNEDVTKNIWKDKKLSKAIESISDNAENGRKVDISEFLEQQKVMDRSL